MFPWTICFGTFSLVVSSRTFLETSCLLDHQRRFFVCYSLSLSLFFTFFCYFILFEFFCIVFPFWSKFWTYYFDMFFPSLTILSSLLIYEKPLPSSLPTQTFVCPPATVSTVQDQRTIPTIPANGIFLINLTRNQKTKAQNKFLSFQIFV